MDSKPYKLYCLADFNGQVFYIGITKQKILTRKYQHISISKRKCPNGIWKYKYYISNKIRQLKWKFNLIPLLHLKTWEDACCKEIEYISWCKKIGLKLANSTKGGNNNKGRPTKDETRKKLSIINSGKNNPQWGKSPSKETREKQRQKMKGKVPKHWLNSNTKKIAIEKIKENLPDKHGSNNPNYGNRGAKSKLSKILLQIDKKGNLIAKHHGLKETAKNLHLNERSIRKAITGERPHYKGYVWKYE